MDEPVDRRDVTPVNASPLTTPSTEHPRQFDLFRSSNLLIVLVRIAIFVLLSFAISSVLQLVLPRHGFLLRLVEGETIAFLGVFAAGFLMASVERRRFGEYGLPAGQIAFTKFLQGALFGLVEISAVIGVIAAFGSYHFGSLVIHGFAIVRWAAFWAVFFLIVGLSEEFSFRGYPQFTLSQGAGFWPAALVLSCAFGAVHLGNPGENPVGIAGVMLTGLFWCFTLRRTGTLWFAVGMHASFDFGETFLYSVPDSGAVFPGHLSNATLAGSAWLTGGTAGPEGSILDFVMLLIFFYAFHRLYPPMPTSSAAPTRN